MTQDGGCSILSAQQRWERFYETTSQEITEFESLAAAVRRVRPCSALALGRIWARAATDAMRARLLLALLTSGSTIDFRILYSLDRVHEARALRARECQNALVMARHAGADSPLRALKDDVFALIWAMAWPR